MTASAPPGLRHVLVFAPYVEENGVLLSPHYDIPEYRAEIGSWMQALSLTWDWRPITAAGLDAAHDVSTAPWALIEDTARDLPAAAERIGFPLFIKPDVSAGSYGIQIDSVCYDLTAAQRKVEQLRQGLHGQHFEGAILAEQFVEGREFTVLVVEDAGAPMGLWVLHPGERVFDKRVPPRERFLAFERYWGLPEAERPIPDGEPYYWLSLIHI